jgi:hypothetical protein
MDVIASTSFGIEVDSQKDPNNRFVHYAKEAALGALAGPMMMLISKYTEQCIYLLITAFGIFNLFVEHQVAFSRHQQYKRFMLNKNI